MSADDVMLKLERAMENVRQRVMFSLKVWVQGAAHCAEYATTGGEMDTAAADECRRCYAKIGDWATEEGQAQGTECLATYEPNFAEMCGEKMQAFAENPSIELSVWPPMNQTLRRCVERKCRLLQKTQ